MQLLELWSHPIGSVADYVISPAGGFFPSLVRHEVVPLVRRTILSHNVLHPVPVLVNMPSFVTRFPLVLQSIQQLQIQSASIISPVCNHVVVRRHSPSQGWWHSRISAHENLSFPSIISASVPLFSLWISESLHDGVKETLLVVLVCDFEATEICIPRGFRLMAVMVSV
jgi:hypothetical protein